jgi:DNA recombination protein RmuC
MIIEILLVGLIFLGAVYILNGKNKAGSENVDSIKKSIDDQFFNFSRQIDDRINHHFKVQEVNENRLKQSLDEANKSYKDVENRLNSLFEASRKIYEVGKDVASLNDILKSPKIRGGLGEFLLEDLLAQVIPADNFEVQYAFATGEIVDAIIKLSGGKFVCIDSKFPLENFIKLQNSDADTKDSLKNKFIKDVKKHIDSISVKYVNPAQGTFDFALMYIPAENVYYEIISGSNQEDLIAYCYAKKVIPVSPNNLFVYLQTILVGLKGFQIEQNAKYIYEMLEDLNKKFHGFNEDFSTLGGHIHKAKNKFEQTEKTLSKLNDSFLAVSEKNHLYLEGSE